MLITLSLKWLLLTLALGSIGVSLWAMGWRRYSDGIGGGIAWLVEMLWLMPSGAVLLVWSIVEFFR